MLAAAAFNPRYSDYDIKELQLRITMMKESIAIN